jgi:predicted Fe-Mo cluster-binding NifX family protein
MKIAITAKGAGLGAWLDPAFERSLQIVIIDDDDRFTAFEPQSLGVGEQAGVAAAQRLVSEGVAAVVTGTIPAREYAVLKNAGTKVLHAESGSMLELVEQARGAKLAEISQ